MNLYRGLLGLFVTSVTLWYILIHLHIFITIAKHCQYLTHMHTRAVEVPKKKAVKKAPLTGASGAF